MEKKVNLFCVFVIFVCLTKYCYGVEAYLRKLNEIHSRSSDIDQADAAQQVILRILPNHVDKFVIVVDSKLPENSFEVVKNETTSGSVKIIASSGVAACRGFQYYLKYFLKSQISWDGDHLNKLPREFPDVNLKISSPNKFIYYQNVCTFSYSFVWWQWSDWQRHIDWMALQGINLFLAPVQELIWTRVYKQFNLTDVEIDQHFAGPAFMAWQRMGNMRGWDGPLSSNFKKFSSNLQKQIVSYARQLGMIVALPAFAGHLPVGLDKKFPGSKFTRASVWNRFSDKYCCPLYLDSTDPLFQYIGELFLKEVIEEYGTDHIYFSDPFNELIPESSDPVYIKNSSRAIYQAMQRADKKSVWLLQGWMFVNEALFWTNELIQSFLTANPQGSMLILDLQSERFPQYERTNSFYGQPFIWCMLHNFGGTLGMQGSIDALNSKPMQAISMNHSTMVGFGLTPEGINQNYFIYELAMEIGWEMTAKNLTEFCDHYIQSRYGDRNHELLDGWMTLVGSVYNYTGLIQLHGKYTLSKRPNLNYSPWTWYNSSEVRYAWSKFLSAAPQFRNNDLYRHDLVDVTRQYLQILTDSYWITIRELYKSRKLSEFLKFSDDFKEILEDLDIILKTHENFGLGKWLDSANKLALDTGDDGLVDLYESNARNQISLWGPNGEIVDYASKQWSGVVRDLFLPRWRLFFNELAASIITRVKINNEVIKISMLIYVERPFVDSRNYSSSVIGDSVDVSTELFEKWSGRMEALNLPSIPFTVNKTARQKHKIKKTKFYVD